MRSIFRINLKCNLFLMLLVFFLTDTVHHTVLGILYHYSNLLNLSECCHVCFSSICLHTTGGCQRYVCMHVCLCAMDLPTSSSGGNVSVPLTPVFPIWLVHALSQQWQLFNQGTIKRGGRRTHELGSTVKIPVRILLQTCTQKKNSVKTDSAVLQYFNKL